MDFEILTSSESNEWYTPPHIIEKARYVMGSIQLDPASCALAQKWIQADRYFTQNDNGLKQSWIAQTLWLNCPYGRKNLNKGVYGTSAWLEKLHHEHQTGQVKQAIALARGDSKGLQILTRNYPFVECERIHFVSVSGEVGGNPVPGSRIYGLGVDFCKFAEAFNDLGVLLRSVGNENFLNEKVISSAK